MVEKSLVLAGVGNDERQVRKNGVRAKREVPRRFGGGDPLPRLEPLPILIDESDHRNGNSEDPLRHARDAVESFLGRRVENSKRPNGGKPRRLVRRKWSFLHDFPRF